MTGGTASPPISLTLCAHPRVTRVVSGRIHSPLIFPPGRPLICLRHGRLFRCQAAEEARCPWVTGGDVPSFSPTTRAQQSSADHRIQYAKFRRGSHTQNCFLSCQQTLCAFLQNVLQIKGLDHHSGFKSLFFFLISIEGSLNKWISPTLKPAVLFSKFAASLYHPFHHCLPHSQVYFFSQNILQ